MTVARRRRRTTRERRRKQSRERDSHALHRAAAHAALANGGLHPGHVVHRRGHGVHRYAEISDARFDPQTARYRYFGARADPPGGAPALRRAAAAGRPARADAARGAPVALRSVYPYDRYAAPWLVDAVGRRLPRRGVLGR